MKGGSEGHFEIMPWLAAILCICFCGAESPWGDVSDSIAAASLSVGVQHMACLVGSLLNANCSG